MGPAQESEAGLKPTLNIHAEQRDETVVIRLDGEFDLGGELDFEHKLDQAMTGEPKKVVVDLRGLSIPRLHRPAGADSRQRAVTARRLEAGPLAWAAARRTDLRS